MAQPPSLTRYAWLSIAAALLTMALKAAAYLVTGSVGLLSDALESIVNLVAAVVTLFALRVAASPPDDEHPFGHEKAEYISSAIEAAMILVAALAILVSCTYRLLWPQPLQTLALGLVTSAVATVVNLGAARVLLRIGRRRASIALEADGHHLMTDVWTSVAVIIAVGLVALTGWEWLDPLIGIAVALNITRVGWRLLKRSGTGLLDRAVSPGQRAALAAVLTRYRDAHGIEWHALRTREAGARSFVDVHVLVPGAWTVQRGHDLCEAIERELRETGPKTTVLVHLEPLEDQRSFVDQGLDRHDDPPA
jgi:cation diffusion facilitator family transporter